MDKVKVLIADDHPAVRIGLKSIFDLEDSIDVCGEAETGMDVIEMVNKIPVDVILMDINMPKIDGIETTKRLHKTHPAIKILAFSMYDDQHKIVSSLKAGAHGYLLKAANRVEIMEAIQAVMSGNKYIAKEIGDKVIYQMITGSESLETNGEVNEENLSYRETEILTLMAEDNSYKEIAEKLKISKRTVDTHRYNISKKLGIKSMAGLIKYAMSHNLTSV